MAHHRSTRMADFSKQASISPKVTITTTKNKSYWAPSYACPSAGWSYIQPSPSSGSYLFSFPFVSLMKSSCTEVHEQLRRAGLGFTPRSLILKLTSFHLNKVGICWPLPPGSMASLSLWTPRGCEDPPPLNFWVLVLSRGCSTLCIAPRNCLLGVTAAVEGKCHRWESFRKQRQQKGSVTLFHRITEKKPIRFILKEL